MEALSDSARWNGRKQGRELLLTTTRVTCRWQFSEAQCWDAVSRHSGPFLFLRSLQCGLALWALRNSWSCHSGTSPSSPSFRPLCSIQLPSSLETPSLGSGTAVLPSRRFPLFAPHLESSLSSHHFRADAAKGSEPPRHL